MWTWKNEWCKPEICRQFEPNNSNFELLLNTYRTNSHCGFDHRYLCTGTDLFCNEKYFSVLLESAILYFELNHFNQCNQNWDAYNWEYLNKDQMECTFIYTIIASFLSISSSYLDPSPPFFSSASSISQRVAEHDHRAVRFLYWDVAANHSCLGGS